jgi:lysozyme
MKATQGALFRDNKFISNWNTVGKLSTIHRGAYHFLSARNDPLDQAKNFLSVVGTLDSKDMPPCLDIEWDMATVDGQMRDAWADLSPDEIVARALKWLAAVEEATGRIRVIYTSNAWWKGRIKDDKMPLFERYQIWIADYSVKGLEKRSRMSRAEELGPCGSSPKRVSWIRACRETSTPTSSRERWTSSARDSTS